MVLHIFGLNPWCCPTAIGRGLAALFPQGHAGGNNAFPQENQAFTPFFQCRRRPFSRSRTRRLFTRNGIFAVSRRGCSQRYPHPGYAQNYSFWLVEARFAPVDINGDRRAWLRLSGSVAGILGKGRQYGEAALWPRLRVFHSMRKISWISTKWMMVPQLTDGQDDCLVNESCCAGLHVLGKLAG